jgi:hypothetical protein
MKRLGKNSGIGVTTLSRDATLPHMPGAYGPGVDTLLFFVASAWRHSRNGDVGAALAAYRMAERMLPSGSLNPELSILRHNVGSAEGGITAISPTEDRVISFFMSETTIESPTNDGMIYPIIDGAVLEQHIRTFIKRFRPDVHWKNITRELPHTLFLSTGRCGTVSIFQLLQGGQSIPHHTYWWTLPPSSRWEMMCRLLSGRLNTLDAPKTWAETRAAEWLSAISQGRPMIGLNHLDTIFAPAFATVHRRSRFVYLRREPGAVFESFYGKNQWQESQLRAVEYAFDPEFRFRRLPYDLPTNIAWYFHLTQEFARAMGRVVGPDRYMEISSDRLFAQDEAEIGKLIEFTSSGLFLPDATAHFGKKINEKAHKATLSHDDMAEPRAAFFAAMARLAETGRP